MAKDLRCDWCDQTFLYGVAGVEAIGVPFRFIDPLNRQEYDFCSQEHLVEHLKRTYPLLKAQELALA